MKEYCIIKLPNGLLSVCVDITNPFKKIMDDTTNTVGTHKYKDLITGTIIYAFVDSDKTGGKLVGSYYKSLSKKEADDIVKLIFKREWIPEYYFDMKDAKDHYVHDKYPKSNKMKKVFKKNK